MTCEQTAQIHRYHDGDLSPAEQASVRAHLAVCAECSELLADLQNLSQMFATVDLPEVTNRAVNRMQGAWWKAATAKAEDKSIRKLASWMTAAAAAVLVFVPLASPTSRPTVEEPPAGIWADTLALIPPAEGVDTPSADLVQVAQWMANDVNVEQPRQ